MSLKETVTVERNVDPRIADLVYFVRYVSIHLKHIEKNVAHQAIESISDKDLIAMAHSFWDRQHGED